MLLGTSNTSTDSIFYISFPIPNCMMSTKDSPTRAIVSYAPLETDGWTMKQVCLRPLKEKELLIDMVATGVCQTDLHFGKGDTSLGVEHARVMGHEGKSTPAPEALCISHDT